MICRLPLVFALGCLALAGCDGEPTGRANEAAAEQSPSPTPLASASAEPKASIMRPSVVEEATPTPPPPPPPEPVKAIVHFGAGEAALGDEAKAALDRLIEPINALAGPVTIRGHTDSKGNDVDNKRMSERRAEAVRDYLAERGVARDRMTVIGLGEGRPVAPNATLDGKEDEAGRQQNRRVVIVAQPVPAIQARKEQLPPASGPGNDSSPGENQK